MAQTVEAVVTAVQGRERVARATTTGSRNSMVITVDTNGVQLPIGTMIIAEAPGREATSTTSSHRGGNTPALWKLKEVKK